MTYPVIPFLKWTSSPFQETRDSKGATEAAPIAVRLNGMLSSGDDSDKPIKSGDLIDRIILPDIPSLQTWNAYHSRLLTTYPLFNLLA